MPKTELDGLPVIEVPENEEITVAVKPEDLQDSDGLLRVAAAARHSPNQDRVSVLSQFIKRLGGDENI